MNRILFHDLKHHLLSGRCWIEEHRGNWRDELSLQLKTIGGPLLDYYLGRLTVGEIKAEIFDFLETNNLLEEEVYTLFLDSNDGYQRLKLSDGSTWILRKVENESFIHIYPARYSYPCIRVKANILKTVLCSLLFEDDPKIETVNMCRTNYLDLSPMDELKKEPKLDAFHSLLRHFAKKNMKYKVTITPSENLDVSLTSLKVDEFLKEYWGQEVFYTQLKLNDSQFSFFAFRKIEGYNCLIESNYQLTSKGSEIFGFKITPKSVEKCFYNSFTSNERERQFMKITENLKSVLEAEFRLIRFRKNEYCTYVLCKYRRGEAGEGRGRLGFSFLPYTNDEDWENPRSMIWVYWSDFEYLRQFISMDNFDNTSDNDFSKEEMIVTIGKMREHRTDDMKLRAFFDYVANWLEEQLVWANYIGVCGNL